MTDSSKFPPQQGHAWRGDWKQRLYDLVAARGFSSVLEFVSHDPRADLVDLASALGSGDVAAVQLEWCALDEAKERGEVEQLARRMMVSTLHKTPEGWPGANDLEARQRLGMTLASWSSTISSHLREYKGRTLKMALAVLDEDLPKGWLPAGVDDPRLVDMFARLWVEPA